MAPAGTERSWRHTTGQNLDWSSLLALTAALLVLLAAAARTGIIAPDLRLFTHNRLLAHELAVGELPAVLLLHELRNLVMVAELVVRRIQRAKLDDTRLVALLASLGLDDLKAMPFRRSAPRLRGLLVELLLNGIGGARLEIVDVTRHIRRVTRAHNLFGRLGLGRTGNDGTAAFPESLSRLAGTKIFVLDFVIHSDVYILPKSGQ